VQAILAIRCVVHGEAGLLQTLYDKRGNLLIVFCNQYSHGFAPTDKQESLRSVKRSIKLGGAGVKTDGGAALS
jgi:hypothetical protein